MALYWEDLKPGDELTTGARTVTEHDVMSFAGLSGDFNPLHTDAEFAKTTPFGERIAHGILVLAMASGLMNLAGWFTGTTVALLGYNVTWKGATRFGDTIRVKMRVDDVRETSKPDRGIVNRTIHVINQRGEIVMEATSPIMLLRRPQSAPVSAQA